jgi:hypothetical protein
MRALSWWSSLARAINVSQEEKHDMVRNGTMLVLGVVSLTAVGCAPGVQPEGSGPYFDSDAALQSATTVRQPKYCGPGGSYSWATDRCVGQAP